MTQSSPLRILLISPYHTGSHKAWSEGYVKHSQNDIRLLALPGRFWKWRMHGGAITLARRFLEKTPKIDLIVTTDMLDLTTFLSLTRSLTSRIPCLLYMHENQLTYPLPDDGDRGPMRHQKGERDQHYTFINWASMMTADHIVFNSEYHRRTLFNSLPGFLKHFPDFNELETLPLIENRSSVLPVGVDLKRLDSGYDSSEGVESQAPLIIWNQRWEYDKNPAQFFEALYKMKEEGLSFRLAVCGERFSRQPSEFEKAAELLSNQIVHWGYAEEDMYRHLLWDADIIVSTALHEFFGIGLIEALYCQTYPILPNKMSYPEILPPEYHESCLYRDEAELHERLRWALMRPSESANIARRLTLPVSGYDWSNMAPKYDLFLGNLPNQVHRLI